MDAITLLKSQHHAVGALFARFEKTEDPAARLEIFNAIADNLAAHCAIEEKLFYPSVFIDALEDDLYEATEEHLAAKRLIADLLDLSPADKHFAAKMAVLKEQIEHHVEEEEDDLFPSVRKVMPKRELEALGEKMAAMFKDEMNGTPRDHIPGETTEAAALH